MVSNEISELPTDAVGELGHSITATRITKMGLIYRQLRERDKGVDAFIEPIIEGRPTGSYIAVQIKCGQSFFTNEHEAKVPIAFSKCHAEYWKRHSIPVIGVLVEENSENAFWTPLDADTLLSTGANYKAIFSRSKKLEPAQNRDVVELAEAVVGPTEFEIFEEEDVSTGVLRRLSYYVSLNSSRQAWNKLRIRRLIAKITTGAMSSDYYRNELIEMNHGGKAPGVVWTYVYQSPSHRNLGAYIARSLKIDQNVPEHFRPGGFPIAEKFFDIAIEWNETFREIVELSNAKRSSKGEYVRYAKDAIEFLKSILRQFRECDASSYTGRERISDIAHRLSNERPYRVNPPTFCEEVDNRIEEALLHLENSGLLAARPNSEQNRLNINQVSMYIRCAEESVPKAEYELEKIN